MKWKSLIVFIVLWSVAVAGAPAQITPATTADGTTYSVDRQGQLIRQLGAEPGTRWDPLPGRRSPAIRALFASGGDLYIAYEERGQATIAAVDFGEGMRPPVWAGGLAVQAFAVGPAGDLYILALAEGYALHVYDRDGTRVRRGIPVGVARDEQPAYRAWLRRAFLRVRPDGRVFLAFNPVLSRAVGWDFTRVLEYTASGDLVRSHGFDDPVWSIGLDGKYMLVWTIPGEPSGNAIILRGPATTWRLGEDGSRRRNPD